MQGCSTGLTGDMREDLPGFGSIWSCADHRGHCFADITGTYSLQCSRHLGNALYAAYSKAYFSRASHSAQSGLDYFQVDIKSVNTWVNFASISGEIFFSSTIALPISG